MQPQNTVSPHAPGWRRARHALLFIVAVLSLGVLLGPPAWTPTIRWLLVPIGLAFCVVSVKADRLQGMTLRALADDFRSGRRSPPSYWSDVAVVLFVGAMVVPSLRGG